ncbi:hypothetical protein JXB31_04650 [Candidatus Woesearchaeota archaeon]|nr:hypothetical protein [Candidatus Woesearchaeota archaeon]
MTIRMSQSEKKLFKEAIIKEYKLKHEIANKKQSGYDIFLKNLKKIVPFNIAIGVIACITYWYLNSFKSLVGLVLTGIIWLTIISSLATVFLKPK